MSRGADGPDLRPPPLIAGLTVNDDAGNGAVRKTWHDGEDAVDFYVSFLSDQTIHDQLAGVSGSLANNRDLVCRADEKTYPRNTWLSWGLFCSADENTYPRGT